MHSDFKDIYTHMASSYAKYRPRYPDSLFQYLSSLCSQHSLAWDCGTGNGQAATKLVTYFDHVVATDANEKQIENAFAHSKIEYKVGAAENCGLEDGTVDLVTAAQSLHWFDLNIFFKEVQRVLKPGGVLAFWCYELPKVSPEVDAIVDDYYLGTLGPFWGPEREMVQEGYKTVAIPLQELTSPIKFEMSDNWEFEHMIGYLCTLPAITNYLKQIGINPLESFYGKLKSAWGPRKPRSLSWDLRLRVAKKN